jgi:hypothetical protein
LSRRAAAVDEQARAFGSAGFEARFYALGGHPALVGAPVKAARPAGDLHVELELPSGRPTWAAGRLAGASARQGLRLAVAVDGRVAGTATTYRAGDRVVFALMLAPASGVTDRADVRVYRVRERPLRLQELRAT